MSTLRQPAHVHTATVLSMTASSSSSSSSSTNKALSTSSTSSKNWRGKYLRALNISAPEVDVVSRKKQHHPPASVHTSDLRSQQQQQQQQQLAQQARRNNKSVTFSRSFNTSTDRDDDEFQAARVNWYHVPRTARYSHRRALATREQLTGTNSTNSTNNNNGDYGFALKPDLARGRRCHTDPFVGVSGGDDSTVNGKAVASAPIQIPTATGFGEMYSLGGKLSDLVGDDGGATMLNNNYTSKRKSPVNKNNPNNPNHSRSSNKLVNNNNNQDVLVGNLLSWEEPAVMMTGVVNNNNKSNVTKAVSGGLNLAFSGLQLTGDLGVANNNSSSINISGGGDFLCDEFVETEDEDEDDDEDDDDNDEIFEMEDFDSDNNNNTTLSNTTTSKNKSRRRRTASASQATTTSPATRSSAALPRYHSVRQMRSHGTPSSPTEAMAMELPDSFVPPHQLIQRDCFSIGLRDEFKRRQQPKI